MCGFTFATLVLAISISMSVAEEFSLGDVVEYDASELSADESNMLIRCLVDEKHRSSRALDFCLDKIGKKVAKNDRNDDDALQNSSIYSDVGTPVVLRNVGTVSRSDAVRLWSARYLVEQLGDSVPSVCHLNADFSVKSSKNESPRRRRRGFFVRLLRAARRWMPERLGGLLFGATLYDADESQVDSSSSSKTSETVVQVSPFFYYDLRAPLYGAARDAWRAPYHVATMRGDEFLSRLDALDPLYLSARLGSLVGDDAEHVLAAQASALHALAGGDAALSSALWVGSGGVTSRMHLDAADNVFVQVRGAKHWVMMPPAMHWAASTYSALHPSARQSQAPIEEYLIDDRRMSVPPEHLEVVSPQLADALRETGVQTTLRAGDVLVLPAFWLHHVTVRSRSSVSLSSYVNAVEQQIVGAAYAVELEHLGVYSVLHGDGQQAVATHIIAGLIGRSQLVAPQCVAPPCYTSVRHFVLTLLRCRWQPLLVDPMLGSAAIRHFVPPHDTDAFFGCMPEPNGETDEPLYERLNVVVRGDTERVIDKLVALVVQLPRGIRDFIVADLVEHIAQLVAPIDLIHQFLTVCLTAANSSSAPSTPSPSTVSHSLPTTTK
jgi:Cupin-like domain